jgi:protein involved in polysaccharide export with SLBB domain
VFGAVGRPGYYSFKPGDRLLDALNSSAPAPQASMSNINLIRVDKVKNTAVVQQIDLDKFFKKGELASNVPLQAGDVIFLSDKRRRFGIQDIFGLAAGLNVIDSGVRILTGGIGGR